MKLTYKTSKLTYKSLFQYSLIIIALLVVAVPVFANTTSGEKLLDFSSVESGNSFDSARPLTKGINVNHLNPGEENWYIYSRESFKELESSWISLAMRYQSEALLGSEQVNFQVFAQAPPNGWFQQAELPQESMGTGIQSPLKATNQSLVEMFWTGHVEKDEQYYVRVFNNSPFGLEYSLEAQVEQPAVSGATPASFNAAIPANTRQTAWTLTAQAINNMSAEEAATWMEQAQAVGWLVTDGTLADEIPNPGEANAATLWQLTAQAIEGQDAQSAAQWLIQADSLGWLAIPLNTVKNPSKGVQPEETGGGDDNGEPPAQPVEPELLEQDYTPVNIYPNQPLAFDFNNVNSGRLAPYGEHWYELVLGDHDDEMIENMKMTMFFTPMTGYMSNRVNFEIFPASQYHIWSRGDSDYMEHFGLGLWVSRDEDPDTGERLWNGTLVDGDRYLVKVKNGTPDEIDYYLFPNDVENAELGNPILHHLDGVTGQSQYAVSPPTRAGTAP